MQLSARISLPEFPPPADDDILWGWRLFVVKHILFVGGDETQRNITRSLARGRDYADELVVDFWHPCWNSNWNKTTDEVKRRLAGTHIVILTKDVRTRLGQNVRKLAQRAGVRCITVHARGRGSIVRAIEQAASLCGGPPARMAA